MTKRVKIGVVMDDRFKSRTRADNIDKAIDLVDGLVDGLEGSAVSQYRNIAENAFIDDANTENPNGLSVVENQTVPLSILKSGKPKYGFPCRLVQ